MKHPKDGHEKQQNVIIKRIHLIIEKTKIYKKCNEIEVNRQWLLSAVFIVNSTLIDRYRVLTATTICSQIIRFHKRRTSNLDFIRYTSACTTYRRQSLISNVSGCIVDVQENKQNRI